MHRSGSRRMGQGTEMLIYRRDAESAERVVFIENREMAILNKTSALGRKSGILFVCRRLPTNKKRVFSAPQRLRGERKLGNFLDDLCSRSEREYGHQ